MRNPMVPFLETICSNDGIEPQPQPGWPQFWSNVYPTGYGYARPSREYADRFRSHAQPILYRVKVKRKQEQRA